MAHQKILVINPIGAIGHFPEDVVAQGIHTVFFS